MTSLNSDQALQQLMSGNQRYVTAQVTQLLHPHQTPQRRAEVAQGQHPFAIILSCADSRVPPEIVFDQGLGDLFVVRVAGNIVDDVVTGSIEYAAEHLHVPLLVVMGHSKCGAVAATVAGGEVPGHLPSLVQAIQPAVDKAKGQLGDLLDNAIKANVALVVEQLKSSQPILAHLVHEGKLKVVGARYDLESGAVDVIA